MALGFTGHATDAASGLTYMQQRYYDPVAMRFLSVDPEQSEFSRYSYGANNPFKFVDPDGRGVTFSFSNGATPLDALKTIAYLAQSPTATAEIAQIQNSATTYDISFSKGDDNMQYEKENRTVHVDVTSGLKVGESGAIQSPAVGAAHEISHAAEHDRIGTDALMKNSESPSTSYTDGETTVIVSKPSIEEERATRVESKIAGELKEPARAKYDDQKGTVRTCGPTSRKGC